MLTGLVRDRRRVVPWETGVLRSRLNHAQLGALESLEHDGWELRFVRDQRPPVPVAFYQPDLYAVIRPDGSIDHGAAIVLRR